MLYRFADSLQAGAYVPACKLSYYKKLDDIFRNIDVIVSDDVSRGNKVTVSQVISRNIESQYTMVHFEIAFS